jgi:acyl-homoserine-lactone acylase
MMLTSSTHRRVLLPTALCLLVHVGALAAQAPDLARQVEIRRTTYGVPQIHAENLKAAAFALAYVQLEDYGPRIALGLLRARGEAARLLGPQHIEADFAARPAWLRAVETYHLLDQETRDVYEGFAAGVNRYVERYPEKFPPGLTPDFTGLDVAARDVVVPGRNGGRRVIERLRGGGRTEADVVEGADADEGSNAWAFAPSRTASGKAILLRNPHLAWSAGYYEAHLRVPGVLDFYGDFRIGGPFTVIGGFNEHLGWSTTNNEVDPDEVYALDADPARPDHYLFDGASLPLRRETITVQYRNGDALTTETRESWHSALGPVVYRADGKIYVYSLAGAGDYRAGQQFLRMMRARSLGEWKDAMRIGARATSNFTYADRAGNIFYVWNGTVPALPRPSGGDTVAVPARGSGDVWNRLIPFDSLPQLLNPRGGYVRNENDPFHYTNLNAVIDGARFGSNFPAPRLRLRSQLSLDLIHRPGRKLSLDDVVRLKHSPRMLLADRVKTDLIAAVRAMAPTGDVAAALALLERWDNTAAADSRGGVLFETWWSRYGRLAGEGVPPAGREAALYREPWTAAEPAATPRGLARPDLAAQAFVRAVEETTRRHGAFDVTWGDVHRVRRGGVDVPVAGCSGALGCFRVLQFRDEPDGRRAVTGGDGWVLAVEFTSPPKAYTVLAYGQSPDPASPHHADQAAMFARGDMKRVAFTERDIAAATIRRYRPGLE